VFSIRVIFHARGPNSAFLAPQQFKTMHQEDFNRKEYKDYRDKNLWQPKHQDREWKMEHGNQPPSSIRQTPSSTPAVTAAGRDARFGPFPSCKSCASCRAPRPNPALMPSNARL